MAISSLFPMIPYPGTNTISNTAQATMLPPPIIKPQVTCKSSPACALSKSKILWENGAQLHHQKSQPENLISGTSLQIIVLSLALENV